MDYSDLFLKYDDWLSKPYGQRVVQEVSETIEQIDFSDWKGRFLQIGACGTNPWIDHLDFASKWLFLPVHHMVTDVVAHPLELPLPNQVIDVLFAPFIFDLGIAPEQFLFEADRVLSSMGLLIFVGLNPTSLWRISRFFSFSKKAWYQTNSGASAWHIKKIFEHIDYQTLKMDFFYYMPPLHNINLIRYFNWINKLSKLIAFYPPSFYVLVLQKRDKAFTDFLSVEKSTWC